MLRFVCLIFSLITCLSHAEVLITSKNAKELTYFPTRSAPAKVVSLNTSLIPAELAAKVNSLLVDVGQEVSQGQLLATLDCQTTELIHQVEKAKQAQLQAQLNFDKRELRRGEKLAKQKNIGEAELDTRQNKQLTSQATFNSQQAALALAALNVERCNIVAPYSGIITKRIASVGEMIDVGKPVLEMVETSNLEVSAKVATNDKASFLAASKYALTVNKQRYLVALKQIVAIIADNDRSQEVRLTFNDTAPIIGSTGRLYWQSPNAYLPAHLLIKREQQYGYFIVKDNKAKFIPVENAEEGRPILFSLPESSQIIVDGRHGLTDGSLVKIVKKAAN